MKIIKIFAFSLLLVSCSTVSKQSVKVTNYSYSNVVFNPQDISRNISEDIVLTIKPVDAKDLDAIVINSIISDGNYKKEEFLSFDFYRTLYNGLSLKDKRDLKMFEKKLSGIKKILSDGYIEDTIADSLAYKIYNSLILNKDYGFDGSEGELKRNNNNYGDINPYKIGNKYLSVFQLSFVNKGKNVESIDINDFQISSDSELLYPFKINYFENIKEKSPKIMDESKLKFIYRMNMPDLLRLTPNQRVVKFFATPAIMSNNKNLELNYIIDGDVVDFSFLVNTEAITEKLYFTKYHIMNSGRYIQDFDVVIELYNGKIFPLKGYDLFINDDYLMNPITIYSIGTDSAGRIYYAKETVIPSSIKKSKINLDFQRIVDR